MYTYNSRENKAVIRELFVTNKVPGVFTMKFSLATLLLSYLFFDVPGTSGDVGTASAYDPPYLRM